MSAYCVSRVFARVQNNCRQQQNTRKYCRQCVFYLVGRGSRVTVANGGQITLYAEWAKSLDRDDLVYIVRGDEIVLTGYRGKGDVQPFVIPAEIDGKPVVEIGGSLLQVIASIGK